jgi:hypothetical protein
MSKVYNDISANNINSNGSSDLNLSVAGVPVLIIESSGDAKLENKLKESTIVETTTTLSNTKNISFIDTIVSGGGGDPTFTSIGRVKSNTIITRAMTTDSLNNVWVCSNFSDAGSQDTRIFDLGTNGASEGATNSIIIPTQSPILQYSMVYKYNSSGVAVNCAFMDISDSGVGVNGIARDSSDNIAVFGNYNEDSTVLNINDMSTVGGTVSTNSVSLPVTVSTSFNLPYIVIYNNSGIAQLSTSVIVPNASGFYYASDGHFGSDDKLYMTGAYLSSGTSAIKTFSTTGGVASTTPAVTLPTTNGPTLQANYVIIYNSSLVPQLSSRVVSDYNSVSQNNNDNKIRTDSSDNIYGFFRHRTDISSFILSFSTTGGVASSVPTDNTSLKNCAIVVKWDSAGAVVGASHLISVAGLVIHGPLLIASDDSIYAGIYYTDSAAINCRHIDSSGGLSASMTLPSSPTYYSAGILKWNSSGVLQSVLRIKSNSSENVYMGDITEDASGDIYYTIDAGYGTVDIHNMDSVGGTTIVATVPAVGVPKNIIVKMSSSGVVSSAGFLIGHASATTSSREIIRISDSGDFYMLSGTEQTGIWNTYDFATSGWVTSAVTGAAKTGSNSGYLIKLDPASATSVNEFKLISNLAAGDAGFTKKIVNVGAAPKTVNVRDSGDTATLKTISSITKSASLMWNGTAYYEL